MPKGSIAEVMLKVLNAGDVRHAILKYHELKAEKPDDYDFSERELNRLGYLLLRQERIEDAILVFKENVTIHPDSWNVYDSLGEAYLKNLETEKAIRFYEKSLSLNPGNENARKVLERIRR